VAESQAVWLLWYIIPQSKAVLWGFALLPLRGADHMLTSGVRLGDDCEIKNPAAVCTVGEFHCLMSCCAVGRRPGEVALIAVSMADSVADSGFGLRGNQVPIPSLARACSQRLEPGPLQVFQVHPVDPFDGLFVDLPLSEDVE